MIYKIFCRLIRFTNKKALSTLLVFLLAFVFSAMLWYIYRPQPMVQDEFSYLLSADTFAHGRLSNPGIVDGAAFDSFHILVEPRYASKYPPAQGLFLAFGKVLFGNAIVGVWLSISLACSAVCWMLQAWMPARWAFLGGLIAIAQLVLFGVPFDKGLPVGYWSQGFFGGGVAALGGALIYGALRRLGRRITLPYSVVFATGLALLFLSRPFEGFLACLPALIVFVALALRAGRTSLPALIPVAIIGCSAVLFQVAINIDTTKDPFLMPYQLYQRNVYSCPPLLIQPLDMHTHLDREVRLLDQENVQIYRRQHSLNGFLSDLMNAKVRPFIQFFFGPILGLFVLLFPFVCKNPWMKLAAVGVLMVLLGLLVETWFLPHYAAPIAGLLYLFLLQAMRKLSQLRLQSRSVGRLAFCILSVAFVAASISKLITERRTDPTSWYNARAAVMKNLEGLSGNHLIFVRYGPEHSFHHEWVYNEAELSTARILWVHEGSAQQNRKVIEHYPARTIWLLYDNSPAEFLKRRRPILSRIQ